MRAVPGGARANIAPAAAWPQSDTGALQRQVSASPRFGAGLREQLLLPLCPSQTTPYYGGIEA